LKNRRTKLRSYLLSQSTYRSGMNDLKFIKSEQLNEGVLLKLVLFSPGSVATLIQSFSVYEVPEEYGRFKRLFSVLKWRRIENAKWWPTKDEDQKRPRFFADGFGDLYVKEYRVILVLIPGVIDRRSYLFRVDTNHGYMTTECSIDGIDSSFPYAFKQKYSE
ncbi:hypothetical protein, partial [Pseudomonas protegens]|uniref:hypothetical protein n=1 Tax=Pseudomonas protegens TaxID=380021 RepID=UPI001C1243C3